MHAELKRLEADLAEAKRNTEKHTDELTKRNDEVATLEVELQATLKELEALDDMATVTAKEVLAEENMRRRVRQLDESLGKARALAAEAQTALERAQRDEHAADGGVRRVQEKLADAALVSRLARAARELAPFLHAIDRLGSAPNHPKREGNALLRAGMALQRIDEWSTYGDAATRDLIDLSKQVEQDGSPRKVAA